MIYHVSARAGRGGDGTREKPFQTITEAAKIACAGDEVLVAPGVYREYVNPVNGGSAGGGDYWGRGGEGLEKISGKRMAGENSKRPFRRL